MLWLFYCSSLETHSTRLDPNQSSETQSGSHRRSTMSSPQGVRQRGKESGGSKKRGTTPNPPESNGHANGLGNLVQNGNMEQLKQAGKEAVTNDWDYKLALTVITMLAFVTRFWGITHPNQVVFDEVHFGKVSRCTRKRAGR